MEIQIEREKILKALQFVNGAVERKQTLPILAQILFRCEAKHLMLQATDLEIELQTSVDMAVSNGIEGEVVSFTVPGRKIFEICKTIPENTIIKLKKKDQKLQIEAGKTKFTLPTLSDQDYPSFNQVAVKEHINVSRETLQEVLEKTTFAIAQQDIRHYLNGLMITINAEKLNAVASNGHRLAFSVTPIQREERNETYSFILPKKATSEIMNMMKLVQTAMVPLFITSQYVEVKVDEWVLRTKLIDSKFPDITKVVKQERNHTMLVERDEIKTVLSRAAVLADERNNSVLFKLQPNMLTVHVTNLEQSEELHEEMLVEYTGGELQISFNVRYLLEILTVIKKGTIQWSFQDNKTGVLIQSQSDLDTCFLVMPMRV